MQTDSGDMSRVVEHLAQVEGVAEDILADKQKLIDLDRRRNKTREAMRILQKDKTEEKKWICFGNMFIKVEKKKASRLLEHDFDEIEKEMSKTRTELKPKVNQLRDLEHKEEAKGFNLNPLSDSEMKAVKDLL
ncbi:hypothetical protein BaRGS_00007384 [Batillaria attramentaria]|uniref:P53 and DNA damage-regulated protein 1 n=1 Tax=Batillaria attramentaria TaxID=370345 RepID=A0ABD0LNP4_9CAEN